MQSQVHTKRILLTLRLNYSSFEIILNLPTTFVDILPVTFVVTYMMCRDNISMGQVRVLPQVVYSNNKAEVGKQGAYKKVVVVTVHQRES